MPNAPEGLAAAKAAKLEFRKSFGYSKLVCSFFLPLRSSAALGMYSMEAALHLRW